MAGIRINDQLEIPEEQLQWSFARSSGPGGQNVNKVNSKATLRWVPVDGILTQAAWKRFLASAQRYVTTNGEIVIQSQEHRDQLQNIEICRIKLADLIRAALIPPKRRIKTKPTKGSQRRRLEGKQRQADKKKGRQSNDLN